VGSVVVDAHVHDVIAWISGAPPVAPVDPANAVPFGRFRPATGVWLSTQTPPMVKS
jgi:hypothetical protein